MHSCYDYTFNVRIPVRKALHGEEDSLESIIHCFRRLSVGLGLVRLCLTVHLVSI